MARKKNKQETVAVATTMPIPAPSVSTLKKQQPKKKKQSQSRSVSVRPQMGFAPSTAEGAAWVREYLHPPSAEGQEQARGIPDLSTANAAPVHFVTKDKIGAPAGVLDGQWSVLIVSMPNPQVPAMAVRWIGDAPPGVIPDEDVFLLVNRTFIFGTNATAWRGAASRFRPIKQSLTTRLIAADLYNQGEIAQAKTTLAQYIDPASQGVPGSLNALRVTYALDRLPTAPSQVLALSTKSADREAEEGGFMVSNFVNPAAEYMSAVPVRQEFYLNYVDKQGLIQTKKVELFDGENCVPMYTGMSMGYNLYTSLLPQASISMKAVHSWEVTVDVGSPWMPFSGPGPCPDLGAMELASVEMYQMPDGMPAAMNDFGSFFNKLKAAGSTALKVWDVVGPVAKAGISMLPGGGAVNKAIGVVEGITGR